MSLNGFYKSQIEIINITALKNNFKNNAAQYSVAETLMGWEHSIIYSE